MTVAGPDSMPSPSEACPFHARHRARPCCGRRSSPRGFGFAVWVGVIALVSGCASPSGDSGTEGLLPASPSAGGQTGAIGADSVAHYPLEPGQPTPLGFSAEQAWQAFADRYSARLHYADGRPSTWLHIEVAPSEEPVEAAEPTEEFRVPQLYEDWEAHDDHDALRLSADLHISSDDGAFDETRHLDGLRVHEGLLARIWLELDVAALDGTYNYPVPGGGFGRKGQWLLVLELDPEGRSAGSMQLLNASPHYEGDRAIADWDEEPRASDRYVRGLQDVRACNLDVNRGEGDVDAYRCHSFEAGDDAVFTCGCVGRTAAVRADTCDEALSLDCEVDANTPKN